MEPVQSLALQGADRVAGVMMLRRSWESCEGRRWALVLQLSHDAQSQRKAASTSHAQDYLVFNCSSSWTLSSERGFSSTAKSTDFPSQGFRLKKVKKS